MRERAVVGSVVAISVVLIGLIVAAALMRPEHAPWVTVLPAEGRLIVEDRVPDAWTICFDSAGRYCPTVGELRADGLFVLPERGGQ